MLPSELMKRMTHREYLTLVAYFVKKSGSDKEGTKPKKTKKPVEQAKTDVGFGPPVFEPLTETQKAKLLWAGRVGIKERVT